ncbi:MAG TPA: amidohydrolase family protein [Vicinamibacterales bacterium]|nr:amidohydrolase family protein [Vicinamibacterales bacterium]
MSIQKPTVAALSLALLAASALTDARAAEKAPPQPAGPLDRSGYFEPGALTSDDLRRVPLDPKSGVPKANLVIQNARLFDGTGAPAREATVVVAGNRISAVLPPGTTDWPRDASVIDAAGRTVIPGLVDLHTHMTYLFEFGGAPALTSLNQADAALRGMERLRYFIESGITSIRDTGSHGMAPFILKQWSSEGRIPSPRVFATGQVITATGGHATEGFTFETAPEFEGAMVREANGPEDWRAAVREQFKRGADWIKIASHYDESELKAAVDEAHRLGIRVTVDAETVFSDMAVRLGVDCIEHPLPRSDETVRLMAKNGIASVPTIIPYQIIIQEYGGYYGSTSRRFTLDEPRMFDMLRKMKDAGVRIGVGTDLILDWYRRLPEPYVQELRNLQRVGYTPEQALVAATRTSAEILGMGDKLGTIEPGKLADLVILDGRPDADIEDLAKVRTVVVDGRVVVRDGKLELPRPPEPPKESTF